MRAPYGLNIVDNCVKCTVRRHHMFCNLSPQALQRLDEITSPAAYPAAAVLFVEGQVSRGVFVLCTGKVKLSTTSPQGKTIITRIAEHGDVLGLNAAFSNQPYEVTAEMVEPGQANFIARDAFLRLFRDYSEVAKRVTEQLNNNYYSAHNEICTLGLSRAPQVKLAKLLLGWSTERLDSNTPHHLRLVLTHEEIGEMIGMTRETVTRLFSDFKKKKWIQCNGSTLVIQNESALKRIVQG